MCRGAPRPRRVLAHSTARRGPGGLRAPAPPPNPWVSPRNRLAGFVAGHVRRRRLPRVPRGRGRTGKRGRLTPHVSPLLVLTRWGRTAGLASARAARRPQREHTALTPAPDFDTAPRHGGTSRTSAATGSSSVPVTGRRGVASETEHAPCAQAETPTQGPGGGRGAQGSCSAVVGVSPFGGVSQGRLAGSDGRQPPWL